MYIPPLNSRTGRGVDVAPTRRYADNIRRFADTYSCIKTAFHDTDKDVGVVECGLYATVCVGETSDIVGVTSVGETSCRRNVRSTPGGPRHTWLCECQFVPSASLAPSLLAVLSLFALPLFHLHSCCIHSPTT